MNEHITKKDATKHIQTYLRALEITADDNIPVPIDGIFESITAQAIRNFQSSIGLSPTGTVNKQTWDALYGQYRKEVTSSSALQGLLPFPDTPSDYSITIGTRSSLVSIIQLLLDELGIKYDGIAPREVNGIYDADTADAIKRFQGINMLEPSGEVDKKTWNRLVSEYSNLAY